MRAGVVMGVVQIVVDLTIIFYGALLAKTGGILLMMFAHIDRPYLRLLLNITPFLLLLNLDLQILCRIRSLVSLLLYFLPGSAGLELLLLSQVYPRRRNMHIPCPISI